LLIRLGFNEKAARLFVEILETIFLTRAPPFLEKVIVQRPDGVTVEITSLEDLVMAFESPRQRVSLSLIDGIAQFARLS